MTVTTWCYLQTTSAQMLWLTTDSDQSGNLVNINFELSGHKVRHCSFVCVQINISTTPWLSVFTMIQLTLSESKPFYKRVSTSSVLSESTSTAWHRADYTFINLKKRSDALVRGASVQRLAPPDRSFQSGHHERVAEKRRSRKPVWIFCCLPPAAESCQKEPVSDTFNTC